MKGLPEIGSNLPKMLMKVFRIEAVSQICLLLLLAMTNRMCLTGGGSANGHIWVAFSLQFSGEES